MKVDLTAHDTWIVEPIEHRRLGVADIFERMTEKVEVHFADVPVVYAPGDMPRASSGVLERGQEAAPTHHDGKSVYLNTNIRVAASGIVRPTKLIPEINFFDIGFPRNPRRDELLNHGSTIRVHSLFPDDRYRVIGDAKADATFSAAIDAASLLTVVPVGTDGLTAKADVAVGAQFSGEISLDSVRAHGTLSGTASWEIMRAGNDLEATIPLWVGLLVPCDSTELEFEMRLTAHAWRMPFGTPLETKWVVFRAPLPPAGEPMGTEAETAAAVQAF